MRKFEGPTPWTLRDEIAMGVHVQALPNAPWRGGETPAARAYRIAGDVVAQMSGARGGEIAWPVGESNKISITVSPDDEATGAPAPEERGRQELRRNVKVTVDVAPLEVVREYLEGELSGWGREASDYITNELRHRNLSVAIEPGNGPDEYVLSFRTAPWEYARWFYDALTRYLDSRPETGRPLAVPVGQPAVLDATARAGDGLGSGPV